VDAGRSRVGPEHRRDDDDNDERRDEVHVLKKILKWVAWLFVAFLVYSIFRSPEQAAGLVVGGFQGIAAAFGAVFAFFDAILVQSGSTPPPAP